MGDPALRSTSPEDDELLQYQLEFLKARNDADETECIVLSAILMGIFFEAESYLSITYSMGFWQGSLHC
jgi:hypothetical protein